MLLSAVDDCRSNGPPVIRATRVVTRRDMILTVSGFYASSSHYAVVPIISGTNLDWSTKPFAENQMTLQGLPKMPETKNHDGAKLPEIPRDRVDHIVQP